MKRFKVAYNLGEGLKPTDVSEKVDDLQNQEVHIIDTTGELPNLVIKDIEKGREYVRYLNQPVKENKIDNLIKCINNELEYINNLNRKLIKPEQVIVAYDENDEAIYDVPLKEYLYFRGYESVIKWKMKIIKRKLNELKELLLE